MASHNSKYYAKKIRKRDSKGSATISTLWKNHSDQTKSIVLDLYICVNMFLFIPNSLNCYNTTKLV